jgi:hypothetical protein
MSTPTTVLRLTARDQQFISTGLAWIAACYQHWRSTGRYVNKRHELLWATGLDRGVFAQEHMDHLLTLQVTVGALESGGRLRLSTSMEFAACALAVRVAVTRHRHGHQLLDLDKVTVSAARLLRRIESARKRAKRADVRMQGAEEYQQAAAAWRQHVVWMRVHLLDCRCTQRRRKPPRPPRRSLVSIFTDLARAELIERGHQVPAERELRRLVRLSLRYVRRGRSRFTVRNLIDDPITAAAHFANFVILHDEKTTKKRKQ